MQRTYFELHAYLIDVSNNVMHYNINMWTTNYYYFLISYSYEQLTWLEMTVDMKTRY